MMGPAVGRQDRLFYEFNLEERIPHDHLLRRIDAVLDLSWLRADLAPFYSHTGCPSVDPELMVRMLLIGYCYSIRSERRLCREVELNLAYRWFCRLGLEDKVPHHSTFSVNRHGRFRDSDVLRQVFESIVRRCMEMGLVAGEGFAVDASVIEAMPAASSGSRGARSRGRTRNGPAVRCGRIWRPWIASTRRPIPSVSPKRCRLRTRRRPGPRAGGTR